MDVSPLAVFQHTTPAGVHVLTLSGEIDCSSVSFVGWAFDSGAGDRCASCTVIDFEHVTFMDCSGISFLVYAHRAAQETDGWLRLARVPQPVQRLLYIVGLGDLLPMYATLQAALPSP
ncbi:STAS domain-containing protein [Streptomyces sp. NBC_01275]|uniref:STAS domain-containing protein n=1 Tax=Streptomyces sp. NBC_01275 TaxID=2903807 RepID=UPI0022512DE3|nr:STAS domain-containing protein [Streptomyces sp. NBC_01275]MCX4768096.1 STAS domain-containing protein [Streptomyces sp. NBC_01275]